MALRMVQNADITLDRRAGAGGECGCRTRNSFRDTADVLRLTRRRGGLGGHRRRGRRLRAARSRTRRSASSSASRSARTSSSRTCWSRCSATSPARWASAVRLAMLETQASSSDEHSALAKAFAPSRMRETVAWCREILGGNGIVLDYDVVRFFADAEAIYSYEGTREMNTLIVGRAITGIGAFVLAAYVDTRERGFWSVDAPRLPPCSLQPVSAATKAGMVVAAEPRAVGRSPGVRRDRDRRSSATRRSGHCPRAGSMETRVVPQRLSRCACPNSTISTASVPLRYAHCSGCGAVPGSAA